MLREAAIGSTRWANPRYRASANAERLAIAAVRPLGRLPVCLRLFLHGFLVCLLLLLRGLLRPARIFLGTDALSLHRYYPRKTEGNQQHESGNSFQNVSEQTILHRSYTEAAPGFTPSVTWVIRPLPLENRQKSRLN